MALLFCDSFELYNSPSTTKWDQAQPSFAIAFDSTAARNGSQGLHMTNQGAYLQKNIGAQTTFYIGCAVYIKTANTGTGELFQLGEGTTQQIGLRLTPTGSFQFFRGNTALGSASTIPLTFNAWHYLEMKIVIDSTNGIVELKIDGAFGIQLSSQNTQQTANAWATALVIGNNWNTFNGALNSGAFAEAYFDDFYLLDGSGSANNTYLGDIKVQCVMPSGNGSRNDFTVFGAAANWQCVDEKPPDDGTTFVQTQTLGAIDRYTFPAISAQTVFAVCINMRALKTDASRRSLRGDIKSGATIVDTGRDLDLLETTWQFFQGISETDPNTSAQWTATNINAAEFGIKLSI